MKKYLILFLLLLVPLTYANSLDIDLLTNTFGVDKEIKGDIFLTYDQSINPSTKIISYLDNSKSEKQLKSILDSQNITYTLISGLYDISDPFSTKTTQHALIGIKVPLNSNIQSSQITFERINLPPSISIDIGNDNTTDWEYFGDFLQFNNFILPNTTSDLTEDGTQLLPGISNFYCELINLPQSKKFLVSSHYEAFSQRADLFATILNKNLQKQGECKLPDELTKSWHSCEIELENPVKEDNLICINVKGGLPSEQYYKLSYQENSQSEGYVCQNYCTKQPNDFLIKVKPGVFNKTLSSSTVFQEFQNSLNNYLNSCPSKDGDCIIPLAIKADQDILIKSPEIIYQTPTEIKSTNKLYELTPIDSEVIINTVKIPIQSFHLSTDEIGSHDLEIEFLDLINKTNFTISDIPTANIHLSKTKATTSETIEISGEDSVEVDNPIINYKWDLGDNSTKTGKKIQHSYSEEGTYTITLTITDSEDFQDTTTKTITIQSLKDATQTLMDNIEAEIFSTISNFETSNKKAITTLNLLTKVQNSKNKLEDLKERIDNASDSQLETIYSSLNNLKTETPKSFLILSEITDYQTPSEQDIKDVLNLLNSQTDISVLSALQNKITTRTNIEIIRVIYQDNENQEFTIINKQVTPKTTLTNIYLIEKIPYSLQSDMKNFKFSSIKSSYKSEYSSFTGETFTYVIQENVLNQINEIRTVLISKLLLTPKCGNNICDSDENENTCSEDCQIKTANYTFFIIALIVLIIGFLVYKFVPKLPFKKQKKQPFKSLRNLTALQTYVKNSLAKKTPKVEIRKKLLARGWKKDQIDYVFKKVK